MGEIIKVGGWESRQLYLRLVDVRVSGESVIKAKVALQHQSYCRVGERVRYRGLFTLGYQRRICTKWYDVGQFDRLPFMLNVTRL